jgi:hypothetical protein
MRVNWTLSRLDMHGRTRSAQFRADVLAIATRNGDALELDSDQLIALLQRHRPARRVAQRRGLGDRIERAVKPIARALRLDCLDESGNLKPDSGCAKRRDGINRKFPNA